MVNYRVEDWPLYFQALKDEGCNVLEEMTDDPEYGKFGWVMDPEGRRSNSGSHRQDSEFHA